MPILNPKKIALPFLFLGCLVNVMAQVSKSEQDSDFIQKVEDSQEPDKVLHAEPLYIDLIRDLGARKGEREWNVGLGLSDKLDFDAYEALIEYEWAVIDRLGLEIELPFTFYSTNSEPSEESVPSNQLDALQVALQWSFYVNQENATSMALGYLNEFELSDFDNFGKPLFEGNVYNPFFVIAKRWGTNFHTLIYTGPLFEQDFGDNSFHTTMEFNTNLHYMISGTQNFIGVEFNKELDKGDFDMVMRPQMRLGISEDLMIGIVTGIPVSRENERLSAFLRLIWEPEH